MVHFWRGTPSNSTPILIGKAMSAPAIQRKDCYQKLIYGKILDRLTLPLYQSGATTLAFLTVSKTSLIRSSRKNSCHFINFPSIILIDIESKSLTGYPRLVVLTCIWFDGNCDGAIQDAQNTLKPRTLDGSDTLWNALNMVYKKIVQKRGSSSLPFKIYTTSYGRFFNENTTLCNDSTFDLFQ